MIKLWASTPSHYGTVRIEFMNSVMKLQSYCIRNNIPFTHHLILGESLVNRCRNELVNTFLKSNYTHFLSIDDDIEFQVEDILKLIKADKDVIGAAYAIKSLPRRFVFNLLPDTEPTNDKPFKVACVGTGLLLIKREVFDKLKQGYPENAYQSDTGTNVGEPLHSYFNIEVRDRRLISEDFAFCQDYRNIGGDVWLDPTLHLKHIGFYSYD